LQNTAKGYLGKGTIMHKLVLKRFQVKNFRNIENSGWIPVERVTCFVGRNESGKTALLNAIYKLNPASPEPFNPLREFPRDRFAREFKAGADWPVCAADFELTPEFRSDLKIRLGADIPHKVICTRFYDGHLTTLFDTPLPNDFIAPSELAQALDQYAAGARKVPEDQDREAELLVTRSAIANWANEKKNKLKAIQDVRSPTGIALIKEVMSESNDHSKPDTAALVAALHADAEQLLNRAQARSLQERLEDEIKLQLPVFIYFENYGIIDSAVYLPHFVDDLARTPDDPKIRTIQAMFKHVGLSAQEIMELGREEAAEAKQANQDVTIEMITRDQQRKELRSVKLNSASRDLAGRFAKWFGRQHRHNIRYGVDGNYFRIWVSDDRRPDLDIELESRSKGFQWYFSFYLIFLAESEEGHKDAILLLDEPGIHLHPTAQQELISFFDELAERNMLIYTTHSPFLLDGDHIERIRPVTEEDSGHSRIAIDEWPSDRETIFPLQAAAGYAIMQGLFRHRKNILVEGISDYFYLHSLSLICRAKSRTSLSDDVYIIPCGGARLIGPLASLFLSRAVRPLILLEGDEAGRARGNALMRELYFGNERAVLMLPVVLHKDDCEIEDLIGETVILPALSQMLGVEIALADVDRASALLLEQIRAAAVRLDVSLPDGWKSELARRISSAWATIESVSVPDDVLNRASALFQNINQRFAQFEPRIIR
jgi:energy-coupling factor transporter ATP-binding protein EcfA2